MSRKCILISIPVVLLALLFGCSIPGMGDGGKETPVQASIGDLLRALNNKTIKAIACIDDHSVAIDSDGYLWVTEDNSYGQLGLDPTKIKSVREWRIMDRCGVDKVACGVHFSMYTSQGVLLVTGSNAGGEIGMGETQQVTGWQISVSSGVDQIACGVGFSMCPTGNGSLYVTGYNIYGQLGLGHTDTVKNWKYNYRTSVRNIACGYRHSMYTTTGGDLYVTGYNYYGQLGLGNTYDCRSWTKAPSNATKIACGTFYSLYLDRFGSLWVTGNNSCGQLGLGNTDDQNKWTKAKQSKVKDIDCGQYHSILIKTFSGYGNRLYVAGTNGYGQIDQGKTVYRHVQGGHRQYTAI
jgi:alpha-tubulin suppressor-like RCC1 family protein